MVIHYSRNTKRAAQELRRNMTAQEKRLWYGYLREYPVQFRRQKQIDRFIVDFYCAAARLVIEVDGFQLLMMRIRYMMLSERWYFRSTVYG